MKRALLATLWIGTVATAFAVALQVSGFLVPLASWVARMGLPSGDVGFANFLLVIVLSFAVAWTLLQIPEAPRRVGLVIFLVADLLGATWLFESVGSSFAPLPAIAAASSPPCSSSSSKRPDPAGSAGRPRASSPDVSRNQGLIA